jgi:hypothetical protein
VTLVRLFGTRLFTVFWEGFQTGTSGLGKTGTLVTIPGGWVPFRGPPRVSRMSKFQACRAMSTEVFPGRSKRGAPDRRMTCPGFRSLQGKDFAYAR